MEREGGEFGGKGVEVCTCERGLCTCVKMRVFVLSRYLLCTSEKYYAFFIFSFNTTNLPVSLNIYAYQSSLFTSLLFYCIFSRIVVRR